MRAAVPEPKSNKTSEAILRAVPVGKEASAAKFHYEVVHSLPGRFRVCIDELKTDSEFSRRFAGAVLDGQSGITSVRVNTWNGSAVITYDESNLDFTRVCRHLDRLDVYSAPEPAACLSDRKKHWLHDTLNAIEEVAPGAVQFAFGAGALACAIVEAPVLITGCLLAGSITPIMGRALRTAVDENRFSVDGLDGLAAVLMVGQGSFVAAGFMTALIGLGEFIRECTAQKCQKMISDLLGLAGSSAWVVRGKKRICVPADHVLVGDVVVIYPGEMVPVDGVIISGQAAIDQAKLTGESLPVEVGPGSSVLAATVLVEGKIYVRCEAAGKDTHAQLVVDLVSNAPLHETKTQNYAAKLADKMVMPILITGGVCFLLTRNISRTMSILIFDFATGIRIAAPTAILSSMERAAGHGILIKSGGAIERLAKVDAIIFDKTGTLTIGEPRVTEVIPINGMTQERFLSLTAAVEERLHHPAARAILLHAARQGVTIPDRSDSEHMLGMGVRAQVEGLSVLAGSRALMESQGIDMKPIDAIQIKIRARGESLAYVAIDNKMAGVIAYMDHIRDEATEVVTRLKRMGIKEIIMATGDSEAPAQAVARTAGIDNVLARAFPEKKKELVEQLKARGLTVAVVGDGINDSPALVHGDVAISLRGGTDVARERSDVVLTDDDLRRLPEAIQIARGAMNLVKQNFALIAVPNGVGVVLAAAGAVGPAAATLLNNGSAIVAAVNSLRPLYTATLPGVDGDISMLPTI
jgi:Cu2+-exporting ATPase